MRLKSHTETSQGCIRSWQSSGTGPTIVFLPGNSCNGREFKRQLEGSLGETFRCLAIDINPVRGKHDFTAIHPEKDLSMMQKSAYVALEVLSALKIKAKDAVFFGHGYGAAVALQIAAWQEKQGESVRGVITAGHAPIENNPEGIAAGYCFSEKVNQVLGKEILTDSDSKLYAAEVGFDPENEEEKFAVKAAKKTDGNYRAEMFRTYTKGLNEKEFVETTKTPLAILFGSKDPHIKLEYLESLKEYLYNREVKVIEGAPQVSFWTHADEVNTFIKEFINS